jgi:hypothetical protein
MRTGDSNPHEMTPLPPKEVRLHYPHFRKEWTQKYNGDKSSWQKVCKWENSRNQAAGVSSCPLHADQSSPIPTIARSKKPFL